MPTHGKQGIQHLQCLQIQPGSILHQEIILEKGGARALNTGMWSKPGAKTPHIYSIPKEKGENFGSNNTSKQAHDPT